MPDLFPHVPFSVTEILQFLTDVRSHPSGEVRDSLRDATQVLELGYRMAADEAARAFSRFRENASGEWYVPLWQDVTWVQAGVAAGAGSIPVETDADYRAGGLAIVLRSETECELVTVASATGGTLTLTGTVAATYAGPVLVAPVGTFVAPDGFQADGGFSLIDVSVSFIRSDNADLGASSLATHLSFPVLQDGAVVVSPLDASVSQALDVVDSGFGKIALEAVELYERRRQAVAFADADVGARWARRRLLHALRGRDGAFWLPSFRRDFPLLAGFSGTLLRSSQEFWPEVAALVGRSIQIATGSSFIHRTISAAAVSGGELQLTLNSAPGETVPVGARVSLMTLQRLDADRIQIDHQFLGRGFLSQVRLPTIEVPA